MSLPRALSRLGVVAIAALTALAAWIGVASAHVTVSSSDAAPGGFGKMTFRVPNESDTANTVDVRIQIPQEAAMSSLRVQPVPGWTVTTTTADLAKPMQSHGQQITSYVSVVEFRAVDGGGIAPGQFQEFSLSGGPFPGASTLVLPVVQSYSDGSQAAWIEPTVSGQAEPEHPAPVLNLTNASGDAHAQASGDTASTSSGSPSSTPGVVALVLSIVALLVALVGAYLAWRASRRTVSA